MINLEQNNSGLIPKKITKTEWFVFGVMVVSAVLSFVAVRANAIDDNYLRIYFLDIGQGDAIFIQNYNGNQILIDGGPDNSILQELSKIMPFNDRTIDMVVLTHPHADHLIGLIEVLKRYQVGQILENSYDYQAAEYDEWNDLKKNVKTTQAVTGQTIDLGEAKMEVIYPNAENANQKISNPNNASIVLKLKYGKESVLLTGDIEAQIEKRLTMDGSDIDSDFLKISHHGSKTSSTENFINAVSPLKAFIEVGAGNKFGHPAQSTIDRLDNKQIKYYRTDMDGSVELILDGNNYLINKI